MVEIKCQICGKAFMGESRYSKYCSKECRRVAATQKERESRERRKKRINYSNTLLKKVDTARSMGMTYADWQKAQTLAIVGRVML